MPISLRSSSMRLWENQNIYLEIIYTALNQHSLLLMGEMLVDSSCFPARMMGSSLDRQGPVERLAEAGHADDEVKHIRQIVHFVHPSDQTSCCPICVYVHHSGLASAPHLSSCQTDSSQRACAVVVAVAASSVSFKS